ncbi:Branched-chain amino acid dehydrogenase [deaminating] [hydrothermal vent metagenome]|uniref:Branched-chain amino acid dehydrogenase [deaminating] n=1 Tax=hydrothermal vent metagenome TaxID=652676 RepID=A0A3B0UV10_9ZZZZ
MNHQAVKSDLEIVELAPSNGYQRLLHGRDKSCGLEALISVHSTKFGPAAGGCRMWPFASVKDAIIDVERLSRGMTYKNIAANLPLGGGKAVIIGNPRLDKTEQLLRSFGRFVDHLNGTYYTAEDVGVSPADMEMAASETPYVVGLASGEFASGDPSPVTARGVLLCLERALVHQGGDGNLAGVRVAIQGLGHVGMVFAQYLYERGAILTLSDINPGLSAEAAKKFNAKIVGLDEIYDADVDVFAPCALGGILTPQIISRLKANIVLGAANNQLANPDCGALLHQAGILYAPDYVVNGGGIVNVATEILAIDDPSWANARVKGLADTLETILDRAKASDTPTNIVADLMIEAKLESANV